MKQHYNFEKRHIGINQEEKIQMLQKIGVTSLEKLIEETVPVNIFRKKMENLPFPLSEAEYLSYVDDLGRYNSKCLNYIGLGYNFSPTPAVIQRNVFENPGWYTAYTPYQAEISQGRLEAIFNFQTMICELTGFKLSNASLLDEATAAAEAALMFFNTRTKTQKDNKANKFFVSKWVLPQTISVLETRLYPYNIEIVIEDEGKTDIDNTFFGAILQYPQKYGSVENYKTFIQTVAKKEVKVVLAADLLALAILKSPAELGADVAIGTSQHFGIPLGFGGPAAAYFACKDEFKRDMPGRIIGLSIDKAGNKAFRMALQTREQHIKREKATSNICTSSVLMAVMAGFYAVYNGKEGLQGIAFKIHNLTMTLSKELQKIGFDQENKTFFDTLFVHTGELTEKIKSIAEQNSMNFLYAKDERHIGISISEASELCNIAEILEVFALAKDIDKDFSYLFEQEQDNKECLETDFLRKDDFMSQSVFKKYRTENSLMRYIKELEKKDLALNHSMIPLGSCTMKLNSAALMLPLSNSDWAQIHPFVPQEQTDGYLKMLSDLEDFLCQITGLDACSLQPNSGASGEYAGLRVIREYQIANGEDFRTVCLIPSSAHGTNPASAAMANLDIVTIKTLPDGSIDIEDLRQKAEENKQRLSCLMITYPSTYGIFEVKIKEIIDIIHKNGGQVYMDGANMNAQVGITSPGDIGADVCHLNLHKTFAMPHGGGGPGVGPICVKEHLADFLPSNPIIKVGGNMTAVSAAPYGSALLDLISFGYILMLGDKGLTQATEIAILNANYLKAILEKHFDVLYKGEKGRVAHELIIDIRPIKEKYGADATDFAKRLMDYGFHAPTLSFPVPGTLMIEPTESEGKEELDRFADALINILDEVKMCPDVVKNAPHTLEELSSDVWNYPYSRQKAAYPLEYLKSNKFFPSVKRIDDGYGDRNLCTCWES